MTAAFISSLDLLSEPLRERAAGLRRYLISKHRDSGVAHWVGLAFDAAYAGDEAAAVQCLDRAQEIAAALDSARDQDQSAEQRLRRQKAAQKAAQVTEMVIRLQRGMSGTVPAAVPGPVIAASDGSCKGRHGGWGYLASDGHWGLRAAKMAKGLPREHYVLATELRGAVMAVRALPGPVTLCLDSLNAIRYLAAWQQGQDVIPDGMDCAGMAEAIASRGAELEIIHVYGHRGHLLNEAADALARLGRARRGGDTAYSWEELQSRAEGLAAAFLVSCQEAAAV